MVSEQVTPEQAEAYVRAAWQEVDIDPLYGVTLGKCVIFAGSIVSKHLPNILAAYAYTKERERKIAEKREEIKCAKEAFGHHLGTSACFDGTCNRCKAHKRILAMLEAQLAELLRGFKEVRP